jgi:putative transposase
VIACWVRGLSDRDVEAMLVEVFGQDAGISRSTCSRIGQRLRAEFDTWNRRALSGTRIDYLDLDGSLFKLHPRPGPNRCWSPGDRHRRQAGIPRPGPGRGRVDRRLAGVAGRPDRSGLGCPLLVIPDGGKGLGAAIECSFPASLDQRCVVQVCRNLIAKVPTHAQDQVKRDSWAVLDDIEHDGQAAVAETRRRAKRFIAK